MSLHVLHLLFLRQNEQRLGEQERTLRAQFDQSQQQRETALTQRLQTEFAQVRENLSCISQDVMLLIHLLLV